MGVEGTKWTIQLLWWIQDGAPLHQGRIVTDLLRELFGTRVTALNHRNPEEWPPRSPGLSPLHFFTWDYQKYDIPLADLDEPGRQIRREVNILRQNRWICGDAESLYHKKRWTY